MRRQREDTPVRTDLFHRMPAGEVTPWRCARIADLPSPNDIPEQEAFDQYYRELSKYEYQHRGGRESAAMKRASAA